MTENKPSLLDRVRTNKRAPLYAVWATAVLFSVVTVYWQVNVLGLAYLENWTQIERHQAVMQGTAGNPWQYRVLSEYAAEGFILLFQGLHFPHATAVAFVFFRLLQNLLVFLAAFFLYRRLRLSTAQSLLGLCLLTWSMTNALYDSDLQFNTYSDILFYLLAGLALLSEKPLWIIPLSALAAFNRETGVLIPFMPLISQFRAAPGKERTRAIAAALISLGLFLMIFVGLRLHFGPQALNLAYGHMPGLDLLAYNLFRPITWVMLVATLGILPILAIFAYPRWPRGLKVFFWAVVPIWFLVHAFVSVMAETRLFLVPQALVFIPGAIMLITDGGKDPIPDKETAPGKQRVGGFFR